MVGVAIFALQATAQQVVTGTVTADDDNPLPGVSVVVKGTARGTTTNNEGKFQLNASATDKLVFSFVGYAPQEIEVGNQSLLNVKMAQDFRQLNEVVVTALGIKKDIRRTGTSIQGIDASQTIKAREPNAVQGLVGKVAGLTVAPSAEMLRRPQVILRGNTDILYVVDGVPINSDTWNISPDDIDNYSILKGASASALYGFRGKNGAILITTKRGSKDKRGFAVDFNSSTMFDNTFLTLPKWQDEYGPGDHGVYEFGDGRGGGKNDGDYDVWGPKFEGQLISQYDSPIDPVTGKRIPTPWVARGKNNLTRYLETGVLSTNNIAVSASGDKYNARFSLSNTYQKGIVPNTKLNSTTFNTSFDYKFSKKLSFESNMQFNYQQSPNFPDVNYGPNSMIYNIIMWAGADWSMDDMRNYWQPGKEGVQQIYAEYQRYNNPYFMAYEWLRSHKKNDIIGQVATKYQIAPGIEAMLRTQVSTWNTLRTEKFPYSMGTYGRDERRGDYREDQRNLFDNNTELLVKIDKKIGNDFSINGLVGGNIRTFNFNYNFTTTDYLNVPGVYSFANSANPVRISNFRSNMGVNSAYYSADFSYKNFLTVSTTGRMDQLSTLPKGKNTFFYPSVAASFVVSDLVENLGPISFFKLRSSYANVKDGLTRSTFTGFNQGYGETYSSSYDGPSYENSAVYNTPLAYNGQPAAFYTNTLNNPDIAPNSTSQWEVGADVRFLNNRLTFDAAYFVSNDGPRIFNLPLSGTTGYSSALVNGIKTQKKGVEISVTGTPIKNLRGFTWEVLANWSTFKERLTEVYGGLNRLPSNYFIGGNSGNRFIQIGDRIDAIYSNTFYTSPDGQFINDAGGRPIINPIGQALGFSNPDWVWGLNNRFSYKNWNMSFQFDGRVGGVISNYVQRQTFRGGRHIATIEGAMGEARFQDYKGVKSFVGEGVVIANAVPIKVDADGNITNYAEMQFAPNATKQFLQDYISRRYSPDGGNMMSRSFGKLREVVIGYNLPSGMLQNTFFKQASISIVGRNLLYFAEKKDVDLDQFAGLQGRTDVQSPTLRRYGFNLNLTF
ncbi:MAG: SusC/RagA family TonB-linked outer membrane protein [Cytophagia bacterium]|nr:MAG: SusC/RagA family TonB-linked outer membrane protein [Runella sp.]TAG21667.1 MAG: SusC/RagA family TonB-linked outer membrane protein [Cytophagales bacterium]TAG41059.1 MAG: SusC/RagA family TonB-linked outer membrane protein [Cytophagia bacterium]TAG83852.1 MAG: SusC/RagA family TonB-linked outer membrane protein [Cytophagales bacterium]